MVSKQDQNIGLTKNGVPGIIQAIGFLQALPGVQFPAVPSQPLISDDSDDSSLFPSSLKMTQIPVQGRSGTHPLEV
jgi:hypothetical protein